LAGCSIFNWRWRWGRDNSAIVDCQPRQTVLTCLHRDQYQWITGKVIAEWFHTPLNAQNFQSAIQRYDAQVPDLFLKAAVF
jgi:hypothetical protein